MMALEERGLRQLRSHASHLQTKAFVVNKTGRDISIEWLNMSGDHVCYKSRLPPNKGVLLNTFVGHPWVFYDSDTRHPLVTLPHHQRIYFPEFFQQGKIPMIEVSNPLLSLKQLSLNAIHRHIALSSTGRDEFNAHVDGLPMPAPLTRDLKQLSHEQHDKNMPLYIFPHED